MTEEKLSKEIARLEREKPLIVQWTQYDEDRLWAYREVVTLHRQLQAAIGEARQQNKHSREALFMFMDHYPCGTNPQLDEAYSLAYDIRAALAATEPK